MKARRPIGRKLLVATAGLATLTYVACKEQAVGNLPAPMPDPVDMPVGNLMAYPEPEPSTDPGATPSTTVAVPPDPSEMPVGNLPAPMEMPSAPPLAPKK